jgi:YD repeat-containing protein
LPAARYTDDLSRLILVNAPGTDPDVSYAYDNFGRVTQASQTGHALSYVYDGLGRLLSEAQTLVGRMGERRGFHPDARR